MKWCLTVILSFCFYLLSSGQNVMHNRIFSDDIKTVLMHMEGNELSMPVWTLGSNSKLILSFDDLGEDYRDYYYTIVHCNADWKPSALVQSDYIDGYFEDKINDYQSSFNTTVSYTHYVLEFPNDYMRPYVSGNYVLQVFDNSEPDKVLFNKRFMVIEPKTSVSVKIRNMNQAAYFYNDQELEIVVDYNGSEFYDIAQALKVQILKNYNWISSMELTQPNIIKGNEFTFNDFTRIKFKGGNEFHHFNNKNIHHQAQNIENITFMNNMYHFQLKRDKDRTFDEYVYKPDINGLFKVDVSDSPYPATEADYAYVYFTLGMDAPMQKGDIYVWGALTNFDFSDENKMVYNFEQKDYECSLFLKQGYYNYQYVLVEDDKPDFTYIEGNHSKTNNSYTILVYYTDFGGNYDRIIGFTELNSGEGYAY